MSPEKSVVADSFAEVIACYKRDVDRGLLRAQLAKSVDERFRDVIRMQAVAQELRRAGRDANFLGEIVGGGRFEDLLPQTVELQVFGFPCRVVTLEKLIALKRAAGRPKDLEAIAELESLREEGG